MKPESQSGQSGVSDLGLLRQAATGSRPGALNEVLIKYRESLRRMIAVRMNDRLLGRLDASDIVQETFIEATRALDAYLAKPGLPVHLWLRHLAGQKLIQAHRVHLGAQKRAADREQRLVGGVPAANSASMAFELMGKNSTPSRIAVKNESKDRLMQALEGMGDVDREVLTLRHFEQLTSQETAEVLGMTNEAVKKRYVRALEKLQHILLEDV